MIALQGYEMIHMDLQIPEMDGMQAGREIRMNTQWSHIPIIALSANALASDRNNCLAAGMQDLLEKPITRSALHRVLAQYLGHDSRWPYSGSASPEGVFGDPRAIHCNKVSRSAGVNCSGKVARGITSTGGSCSAALIGSSLMEISALPSNHS